jgi:hypothetical protein
MSSDPTVWILERRHRAGDEPRCFVGVYASEAGALRDKADLERDLHLSQEISLRSEPLRAAAPPVGVDEEVIEQVKRDARMFGNGYLKREANGQLSRIDPTAVTLNVAGPSSAAPGVTEAMIDAGLGQANVDAELPFMARIADHGKEGIQAADEEANRRNREWMASVLRAALAASPAPTEGPGR